MSRVCHHCGKSNNNAGITFDNLYFCCQGCKAVYRLIHKNELGDFYDLYPNKGNIPSRASNYAFLDDKIFCQKLEEFRAEDQVQISLSVPGIHCSACIWILENLPRIKSGIVRAEVQFSNRILSLFFDESKIDLKRICLILDQLGYPPDFSLSSQKNPQSHKKNRELWIKIGLSGFAFGNTMFLSLATYFETDETWLVELRPWFDMLMFVMSLPVVFYAAKDYFIQSLKSIQNKFWSLDIPIAIGISVLFLKSIHNAFVLHTLPYFDSLAGLVFFLLIGKYMQKRVYQSFSFERDYRSFFPMAVSIISSGNKEKSIPINEIQKADHIILKPGEIIPVDGEVLNRSAILDYSFVTGESREVISKKGDKVFAGAKVLKRNTRVKAEKTLDQSYLVRLWNQKDKGGESPKNTPSLADRLSRIFTPVILAVSLIAGGVWMLVDSSRVVEVVAAVLIVACPCALALSGPFVLGNMLRYMGRIGCYIKNTGALLRIVSTNHWVFDKTGTLTQTGGQESIFFRGKKPLSESEKQAIRSLVYSSNHPLSRAIFNHLRGIKWSREVETKQLTGKGLEAQINGHLYRLGSAELVKGCREKDGFGSSVHLSVDENYRGHFEIRHRFRKNIAQLFQNMGNRNVSILSGDHPYEASFLEKITPQNSDLRFHQSPFEKIEHIKKLRKKNKVLMFGDGLNDAGALKESDSGIAISNESHLFTPACDAILTGKRLTQFPIIFHALEKSIRLVRFSFVFSLVYNTIGISIACLGYLTPIIAAVLMPLSSISVVLFASLSTSVLYNGLLKKLKS